MSLRIFWRPSRGPAPALRGPSAGIRAIANLLLGSFRQVSWRTPLESTPHRHIWICSLTGSLLCSEMSTNLVWSTRFYPLGAPHRWTTKGICRRDEQSHSREPYPSLAIRDCWWRVAGDAVAFVHGATHAGSGGRGWADSLVAHWRERPRVARPSQSFRSAGLHGDRHALRRAGEARREVAGRPEPGRGVERLRRQPDLHLYAA